MLRRDIILVYDSTQRDNKVVYREGGVQEGQLSADPFLDVKFEDLC